MKAPSEPVRRTRTATGALSDAPESVRNTVIRFLVADLVVVVLVAVGLTVASQRAGEAEGILDVKDRTSIVAASLPPLRLNADGTRLDPASRAAVGRLVATERSRAQLLRAKVWNEAGDVLYSDEVRLVGKNFPLAGEEVDALANNRPIAEVTDLSNSENQFERTAGRALQVYLPISSVDGQSLLFETYYPYRVVQEAAARYRRAFRGPALLGLSLLTVLQVVLVWGVARRLRRVQDQREQALVSAIDSSMLERRRIAADLHDGVVQELAGLALALGGASQRLRVAAAADPPAPADPAVADLVGSAAADTRTAIAALRSLLVEIYPPNLEEAGLDAALEGLAAGLRNRNIAVSLKVDADLDLDRNGQALVFRAAQELMRNVQRHSRAEHAWVEVRTDGPHTVLVVADDGIGIDPDAARTGHFGTRLLADLADEIGGTFTIGPGADGGTTARMEVPNR